MQRAPDILFGIEILKFAELQKGPRRRRQRQLPVVNPRAEEPSPCGFFGPQYGSFSFPLSVS